MTMVASVSAEPARWRRSIHVSEKEDVDKHLVEFLDWWKKEANASADDRSNLRIAIREMRKSNEKLDRVANAQQQLFNQFTLHEQKDEARHEELRDDFRGLASRVNKLEDAAESTGKHNVEELQRQLRERDENQRWWKRHATTVITGIIATLVTALLVGGCTYLFTHQPAAQISVEPAHH